MATIQVTPELLKGKATELRGLKTTHDENMTRMRTLIMGLNEIWKGEAQDALIVKYEGMQSTFTSFSEMLEGYAKLMDQSADKLQEMDSSLAANIAGFGV